MKNWLEKISLDSMPAIPSAQPADSGQTKSIIQMLETNSLPREQWDMAHRNLLADRLNACEQLRQRLVQIGMGAKSQVSTMHSLVCKGQPLGEEMENVPEEEQPYADDMEIQEQEPVI